MPAEAGSDPKEALTLIKRILNAGLAVVLALGMVSSVPVRNLPTVAPVSSASAAAPSDATPVDLGRVGVRAPVPAPKAVPDTRQVVVRAKPGVDVSAFVGSAKPVHGNYILRVPKGTSTAAYSAKLAGSGRFAYATPDRIAYPMGYTSTPNDPDFTSSAAYGVAQSGNSYVPYAKSWWVSDHGGAGNTASPDFDLVWPYLSTAVTSTPYYARATNTQVKVAVIDTGFYFNIPDVSPNIVAGKDEFSTYTNGVYTTDNDVTPASGGADADHGTMVASEIAQATNNAIGGAAAGWDTQVRMYKVQGLWTEANQIVILDSAITNAIYDATNDGCRVITMSLGSSGNDPSMQAAIDYAYSKGVFVCASSGNDGTGTVAYPAANNHVIGVGAYSLTSGGTGTPVRSDFSNWGTGLDILAPGDALWGPTESTPGNPGYNFWSGTSMASPVVAAAAALVLRFAPNLGADDVAGVLESSARDIGATGYDTTNGWGCLNMNAAYNLLKSTYPNLSAPALSGVSAGGTYASHSIGISWSAVPGYQVKYVVSADGSALTTTSATSSTLTGLADGPHSVRVASTSVRNWAVGSAATVTFTVDTIAPAAPTVTYTDGAVYWTTAETTGSAQVAIDSTASPTGVSWTPPYLVPAGYGYGSHEAYVRIIDAAGNVGSWGKVAFSIGTSPPPAAPTLSWNAATQVLSWTPAGPGVTTQFALDDPATATTVSAASWSPTPSTPRGTHTAYVRMTDAAGRAGSWGTLTFTVVDPVQVVASVLSFRSAVPLAVAWRGTATLSGSLIGSDTVPVAGGPIVLQRSLDSGSTWSTVMTATTDASGSWTASWVPGRSMLVRASFPGDATHAAARSGDDVALTQLVGLGTPSKPPTLAHGRSFTEYVYLTPRAAAGTRPVSFLFYRWEKHNGAYTWTLRKSVSSKAANYSSYSKCSVSTSVAYAGSWKVVARYGASALYGQTLSAARTFSAK